jgi:hypothetical protein
LKNVEWGEFSIRELFEVTSSEKRFDANKVTVLENGKFPYVVRTSLNNGIKGYISENEAFLNDGNTIAFGQDTATMFYQEKPYFTGDKIKILHSKNAQFNEWNAQFFISVMSKAFSSFSWGASSFNVKIIEDQKIHLPVKNSTIDFAFMESFIAELEAELEAERLAGLEAYLLATGLKDTTLTTEEEYALKAVENVVWKNFNVVDIFNVRNTRNILSRDIVENSGTTPYLCASAKNNAVSSYISFDEGYLEKGNCIFIGGKTFVVTYQENDFYSNDSHNLVLYVKDETAGKSKQIQLFLAACTNKSLGHQYSWGDSISNRKIQTDQVLLPTQNHQPDYALMGTLISAIQKLVRSP